MVRKFLNVLTEDRAKALYAALDRCLALADFYQSWQGDTPYVTELTRAFDETLVLAKKFPAEFMVQLYEDILRTRLTYDKIISHTKKHAKTPQDATIPGPAFTGYRQEGVGAGISRAMRKEDYLYQTHRDMSASQSRGDTLLRIFLNHLGKVTGPTQGYDGNIHYIDSATNTFGFQVSTMGISVVVGLGPVIPANQEKATKLGRELLPDERNAAVVMFGDGAASNGMPHEGMNLAKAWNIPALFVILDNGIALSVSSKEQHGGVNLANRALGYEMPGALVDGNDAVVVWLATHWLLTFARRCEHPALLVCKSFRFHGHNEVEDTAYAKEVYGPEEFERLSAPDNDPLVRMRTELTDAGLLTDESKNATIEKMRSEITAVYEKALKDPDPPTDRSVFKPALIDFDCKVTKDLARVYPEPETTRELTLREAYKEAVREELTVDPLLRYIGEDIADPKGGVLGLTLGLSKDFPLQVRNTPIAETAIAGQVAGSSLFGYKVIGEFQFLPFSYSGGEALFTFPATRPAMIGMACGGVFVAPFGIVPSSNNYHSDCIEVHFAALRGMKLLVPATPADIKGMMKSAVRDPDICFMLLQIHELGMRGLVPEQEYFTPLGVATVRKEGSDVTLVTYAPLMVKRALEAAAALEKLGISLEVIDLRTIVPWDKDTVLRSISKTGRVIVMHEASRSFHVGAELAASIVEDMTFYRLKARPLRLTAPDTPVPFHPNLEQTRIPSSTDVVKAAKRLMEES